MFEIFVRLKLKLMASEREPRKESKCNKEWKREKVSKWEKNKNKNTEKEMKNLK